MKHSPGFTRTDTPVVVVNCQLGALSIMRTLGPLGIQLYGVSNSRSAPALRSRYCRGEYILNYDEEHPVPLLDGLLDIAGTFGREAILIPTSDETSQFVADYASELRGHFRFQDNPAALIRELASKREMFELATRLSVPTPRTLFPTRVDEVLDYAKSGSFPVMLKAIHGNRQEVRGKKKMEVAANPGELVELYREMEDPQAPNLMIQEFIPGGDDQVFIFNGYFNGASDCLAAFTGFKVRQHPVHVGCASLGECRWVPDVANTTTDFMKRIGYVGILDIGYRLDPRDGRYKVLDINPRVGQAFRLFVAENDHDVVKALYLDLTGQEQPPCTPREGRRWFIEDYDVIASFHYHQEGSLGFGQWIRSFRGLEEALWFSWRDPVPFFGMVGRLAKRLFSFLVRKAFKGAPRRRPGVALDPKL